MRKLAFAVLVVSAVSSGLVGCGGTSTRKQTTGKAGADGGADATGVAGAAGDTGAAGTGGIAGAAPDASAAGADGAAGAGGAAGDGSAGATAGAGGTAPITLPCDNKPKKALPYAIEADFSVPHVLTNGSVSSWKNVANPTCDATSFPAFPTVTPDGGADGGDASTDAATEAGADADASDAVDSSDETLTLSLDDPDAGADAGDGGVAVDAADGSVDASVTDAAKDSATDAPASTVPACYEFAYDPDACTAAGGAVCWAGVIFQTTDTDARQAGPGLCIDMGATMVTFVARASKNGAIVKFGSIGEGTGVTEQYVTLTTDWAPYSVMIASSVDYDSSSTSGGVWNGFSVVTEPQAHVGGTYILVKDITWTKQ